MLFSSALAHPTVIIRKDHFYKNELCYKQNYTYAEDYELWVRSVRKLKCANIPEVLFHYRIHKSTSDKDEQIKAANDIRLLQIEELGIKPTKEEFEIHESLSYYKIEPSKNYLIKTKFWLEKLQHENSIVNIYPEPEFSIVLAKYWYFVCKFSTNIGLNSWYIFNKSILRKSISLPKKRESKFFLQAMIKRNNIK
jgi:hypothetical protein